MTNQPTNKVVSRYEEAEKYYNQVRNAHAAVSRKLGALERQINGLKVDLDDDIALDAFVVDLLRVERKYQLLAVLLKKAHYEMESQKKVYDAYVASRTEEELREVKGLMRELNDLRYSLGFLDVRLDPRQKNKVNARITEIEQMLGPKHLQIWKAS